MVVLGLLFLLLALLVSPAFAWPSDSQWIPLPKGGNPILDDHLTGGKDGDSDATGSVNVVPYSGSTPAAYIYNDGSYLFYRVRLDADPTGSGGQGILQSFGWGFEIDTDQNADDYEWLIMCDGISSPEVVSLRLNTDKTALGDPSDKAEFVAAEYPLVGNHRIIMADTCTNDSTNPINGCGTTAKDDRDYFLDFRIPYAVFLSATGITENTLVRYFVGSSNSTNNLTERGADLLAGSNLFEMGSDFVTPLGYLPPSLTFHDGSAKFVEDLGGFGDVTMATTGATLYIRVDDLDLNLSTNPGGTVRVELESSVTGDVEVLILTATGVQGKYTASIVTSATDSNGVLAVAAEDTVTVTYIDAVAADSTQSVPRTDTITISSTNTDLSITKTVNDSVPDELDTISYTIIVTNQGPHNVDNVEVTDTLPALSPSLTYKNAALITQGTFNSGTGIWSVGDLDSASSATLMIEVDIQGGTSGNSYTNTASITDADQDGTTINNTDTNTANNSDSATVSVGGADLRITKTVDNDQPTVGDEITYQLRVLNLGPNDATNVTVQDILPSDLIYNSATGDGSFSGDIWTIGNLAKDAGALLNLTVNVGAGTSGNIITNTTSVQLFDQPDPDSSNDTDSVDILVDYIDLEIDKIVSDATPDPNDRITYTLTVTNNGPHQATNVTVTDQLPSGTTYFSDDSAGSYNASAGVWTIGTINSGSSVSLVITVDVDPGTTGQTITNNAEITGVDQPDRDSSNDQDSAAIDVSGTDIQITKTVDNATPGVGDGVTYTLTVTNNGPNPATGLKITDILPGSNNNQIDGVSYNSSSATQGTYSGNSSDWVWDIGSLGVLGSATLTINATVETGTTGLEIINTAMVTAADQADPDGTNNAASALIAVDGADLGITKTVNDEYPDIGDFITYTLELINNGPGDATDIEVTDLIPPELVYNSATSSQGTYSETTGIWAIGSLTYNSTATLELNAEVRNEDKSLIITNNASISSMGQGDPIITNDSDSADIYIAASDLALTKTVDNTTPNENATIAYTIKIKNEGDNPTTAIEVEDILPSGVTYVSHTATQGSYSAGLWAVGDLPVVSDQYNTATLSINATVDSFNPFQPAPTITNIAEIVSLNEIDPNLSNNLASADIVPVTAPNLTIAKFADKANAASGEIITYTVTIINSGSDIATKVVLEDSMSPYTALLMDPYTNSTPFSISNSSGLTIDNIQYANGTLGTGDPAYGYSPLSDPDGDITHWKITMNVGTNISAGEQFSLEYQVQVK